MIRSSAKKRGFNRQLRCTHCGRDSWVGFQPKEMEMNPSGWRVYGAREKTQHPAFLTNRLVNCGLRVRDSAYFVRACSGYLQFPEVSVFLDYLREHPEYVPQDLSGYIPFLDGGRALLLPRGVYPCHAVTRTFFSHVWTKADAAGDMTGMELVRTVCRRPAPLWTLDIAFLTALEEYRDRGDDDNGAVSARYRATERLERGY